VPKRATRQGGRSAKTGRPHLNSADGPPRVRLKAHLNGATLCRQLCRRKPDEAASRRPPSLWLRRRDCGANPL
jgi:hypothetical protein